MPVETKVKCFKYFSTFFQICFDLSGFSLVFRRLVYYAMYYVRYRSGKFFDHLQIRNRFFFKFVQRSVFFGRISHKVSFSQIRRSDSHSGLKFSAIVKKKQ